jgi:phospholipid-binding lipoprotein MlaA
MVSGWQGALAFARLAAFTLGLLAGGCATSPDGNPRDPFEGFNRGVTEFNDGIDKAVMRPVATAYKDVVPQVMRTGVSNFFNNLEDAWTAVNGALQLKPRVTAESVMRFSVNTTFGLLGLFDLASEMNIERHREDFGQTLGRWGVPTGPYLVLPFLGPSTVRDALALPVDVKGNAVAGIDDVSTRNSLLALGIVDDRARLLGVGALIEEASLDRYSFIRDVFLQRRRNDVADGNPPQEAAPAK